MIKIQFTEQDKDILATFSVLLIVLFAVLIMVIQPTMEITGFVLALSITVAIFGIAMTEIYFICS